MSHQPPPIEVVDAHGLRVAIVAARFNGEVVEPLLSGALLALDRCGVEPSDRTIVQVAGAWEIPQALEMLARRGRFDALVALGAVVRGETPHFEYVAGECSRGVAEVARRHGVAVGFGVLTCDTMEQAMARAGGSSGNKGEEAALASLDLALTFRDIQGQRTE